MHGLEGNKIFAAILFGIFITLGVVFVPRILGEAGHLISFVQDPAHFEHDEALCKEDTGKHEIIPGFCLIPESPRPIEPELPFALELASADLELAASLTQKTCGGCHVFTEATGPSKTGPNLWSVIGAQAGTKSSFAGYSGALTGLGETWDYDNLNAFLAGPGAYVPGTKMSYAGQSDQKKRALYVAYLRSLSAAPAALPSQSELDALQAGYDAAQAQFEIDLAAWEAGE